MLNKWNDQDLQATPMEKIILENWKISPLLASTSSPTQDHQFTIPNHWTSLPSGFFKLNFNGASKGNPRKAGYGGVFRSSTSYILIIFYSTLGIESNNAAKLIGLLQGIHIAFNHDLFPLIVEGDS